MKPSETFRPIGVPFTQSVMRLGEWVHKKKIALMSKRSRKTITEACSETSPLDVIFLENYMVFMMVQTINLRWAHFGNANVLGAQLQKLRYGTLTQRSLKVDIVVTRVVERRRRRMQMG
jgi:gluconate kinase